jgi:hypothetical protein
MFRATVLITLTAATLAAQAPFEGAISMMVVGDNGKAQDLNYMIKGGKLRFDMTGNRGGRPKEPGWGAALGVGGFPLKVQKGETVTLEVKQIEKKSLDVALFAPPEDFQKLDMGMGGLMRKRP